MSKHEELEQRLIDAISDEVVIGEALAAYHEGNNEKLKRIIKDMPSDLQKQLLTDFEMIDFVKEMSEEMELEEIKNS